jgi:predicted permease
VANLDIVPVVKVWKDEQFVDAETRGLLYTMFVAVFGVLLIACANVANLLFGLTMSRGKELAVRTAMGADRMRVVRQLLLESMLLAGVGAILGIGLTYLSLELFTRAVAPLDPPVWMVFHMSGSVLLFVIGVSVFAAFAAGFVPALHATRSDVAGVLRDQSRGSSSRSANRWSAALVTLEVALSCALLVGAGLTVRTTFTVGADAAGVNTQGILTASLSLPNESYCDSAARLQMVERIQRELAVLPGVAVASISSALPGLGTGNYWYGVQGRQYASDSEYSLTGMTTVTPEFFDALDVDLLTGRWFDSRDAVGSDFVVIVDQRFAELNWPDEDPLAKQLRLGRSDSENPWLTVVGVVPAVKMAQPTSFGAQPPEGIFVPATQRPMAGFAVMLRSSSGDPLALAVGLRDVVGRLDSDVPVESLATPERRLREMNMQFVIIGWMFSIFGIVALLLASVGLYAVMAFSVSRRQTEVGVRMALGAEPGAIVRLILVQGCKPLGLGIVVGLGLAFLLGKALASTLYGVSATDLA